ncbi:hypothetical protein T11_17577 [Trichinella zimbabwensis]|uniref:Uncharacterized protein n=1 Tax=Trichinella zimbabwensis TaxID=268475 RepID=A0A0V1I1C8_9BILA|nr:hypothetical protein T11_17577 [Trichinella zimbabwensis]
MTDFVDGQVAASVIHCSPTWDVTVFTAGDFVKEDEQRVITVIYNRKQLSNGTAEEDGDEGEENFPVTPLSKIAESGRCWDLALFHECKERNDVAERFQK